MKHYESMNQTDRAAAVAVDVRDALPFPFSEQSRTLRMMRRMFRESQPDIDDSEFPLPNVSPELFDIMRGLVLFDTDDMTIFHGGRLDLGKDVPGKHWLLPAIVHSGDQSVPLHVVMSNIDFLHPDDDLSVYRDADFKVSLATETEIKLLAMKPEELELHDALSKGFVGKQIMVRPVTMGNLAFPYIQTPKDLATPAAVRGAIIKFAAFFGLGEQARQKVPSDLRPIYDEIKPTILDLHHFSISKPLSIQHNGNDNILVYNVYPKGDVWRMYQIMTRLPLEELEKLPNPTMRLDSACDNGMLFHDKGCDCHEQLLHALDLAKQEGGFVLHAPTHDGRGYGTALKMETELLKQGRRSAIYHTNDTQWDTKAAAKLLYGNAQWDIRTFYAPGLLLSELGFRNVSVVTDNAQKIHEMKMGAKGNVAIKRISTGTSESHQDDELSVHLNSKHNDARYFQDNISQ